jgi:CheY-like chemotaxis protein
VRRRILIAEPNADVRSLLEVLVRKLGFEPVEAAPADAVLLEPGCEQARATLAGLGDDTPPVVCLSIYPREEGLAPPGSVAYLLKPASRAELGAALRGAFAA